MIVKIINKNPLIRIELLRSAIEFFLKFLIKKISESYILFTDNFKMKVLANSSNSWVRNFDHDNYDVRIPEETWKGRGDIDDKDEDEDDEDDEEDEEDDEDEEDNNDNNDNNGNGNDDNGHPFPEPNPFLYPEFPWDLPLPGPTPYPPPLPGGGGGG